MEALFEKMLVINTVFLRGWYSLLNLSHRFIWSNRL